MKHKDYKTNPFSVPDGYFDSLQEKIYYRIENGNMDNAHENAWSRFFKPALGLAVSFGLIFAIGIGIMRFSKTFIVQENEQETMTAEEYSFMKSLSSNGFDEEYMNYMENTEESVTEEEFIEYLLGEDRVMVYLAATYEGNDE